MYQRVKIVPLPFWVRLLLRAVENLRMIVHPNAINGDARFILIQQAGNRPGSSSAMVASGHEQSVGSAMTVVETMAARLRGSHHPPGLR
jgi:hypothetical protein